MKQSTNVRKLVQKLLSSMISHDIEEWPPNCVALIYQPVRPAYLSENNLEECLSEDISQN